MRSLAEGAVKVYDREKGCGRATPASCVRSGLRRLDIKLPRGNLKTGSEISSSLPTNASPWPATYCRLSRRRWRGRSSIPLTLTRRSPPGCTWP